MGPWPQAEILSGERIMAISKSKHKWAQGTCQGEERRWFGVDDRRHSCVVQLHRCAPQFPGETVSLMCHADVRGIPQSSSVVNGSRYIHRQHKRPELYRCSLYCTREHGLQMFTVDWRAQTNQEAHRLEITMHYFVLKSIRVQQMFTLYTICCLATVKVFVESWCCDTPARAFMDFRISPAHLLSGTLGV